MTPKGIFRPITIALRRLPYLYSITQSENVGYIHIGRGGWAKKEYNTSKGDSKRDESTKELLHYK